VDPTPELQSAIAAYERSLESGKIEAVRQAYPGLTDPQAESWVGFFKLAKGIKAEYRVTNLQHTEDAATVSVQGVLHFTVDGQKQDQPSNYRATFSRSGGAWHITAIQ
jgi:hypothetical protein